MIRDWQQAASNVLVAVGQRFINKVMEEVLTKFQPGILPHYFVMQTFANLSVSNGELATPPPLCAAAGLRWKELWKRCVLRALWFTLYPNSSAAGHLRSVVRAEPAGVLQNKLPGILQLRPGAAQRLRCLLCRMT